MISSLLQAVDGRAVSGNVSGDTPAPGVVRQYSTSGASYSVVFVDSHYPFFILLFEQFRKWNSWSNRYYDTTR